MCMRVILAAPRPCPDCSLLDNPWVLPGAKQMQCGETIDTHGNLQRKTTSPSPALLARCWSLRRWKWTFRCAFSADNCVKYLFSGVCVPAPVGFAVVGELIVVGLPW
jgi:hypothetical protein